MNKRKILSYVPNFLMLVFAFLAWQSVQSAVIIPDSSTWAVPMMLFSAYIILIYLSVLLSQNNLLLKLVLLGSLSPSLFFAFDWLQFVAILLSGAFLLLASRRVREDMDFNLKISIWKSLRAGKSYLLISIAFLISMQYFLTLNNFDGEKKVPRFDASFITKKIAIPFLSSVNPQFEVLKDQELTVDQFILQSQKDFVQNGELSPENEQLLDAQLPANLTLAQKEALKKQAIENFLGAEAQMSQKNQDLILQNGRKQFADLAGIPIVGNEKISEIFSGLVSNKINSYFNTDATGSEKSSIFSIILAAVLFLTIYPIGSIISIAWFLIIKFIMFVLFKAKMLSVKIETVSKEVLE